MKQTMLKNQALRCRHQGKLITNNVILKEHEQKTVNFLLSLGYDIELIPKSNKQGEHTADFKMRGFEWEMKAPRGEGKYLIANTVQKARKQSANMIIDLRCTKRHEAKCLREIEKEFVLSKRIRCIKIITKCGQLLDFSR